MWHVAWCGGEIEMKWNELSESENEPHRVFFVVDTVTIGQAEPSVVIIQITIKILFSLILKLYAPRLKSIQVFYFTGAILNIIDHRSINLYALSTHPLHLTNFYFLLLQQCKCLLLCFFSWHHGRTFFYFLKRRHVKSHKNIRIFNYIYNYKTWIPTMPGPLSHHLWPLYSPAYGLGGDNITCTLHHQTLMAQRLLRRNTYKISCTIATTPCAWRSPLLTPR